MSTDEANRKGRSGEFVCLPEIFLVKLATKSKTNICAWTCSFQRWHGAVDDFRREWLIVTVLLQYSRTACRANQFMVDRSKGEPLSRRLLIKIGPFFYCYRFSLSQCKLSNLQSYNLLELVWWGSVSAFGSQIGRGPPDQHCQQPCNVVAFLNEGSDWQGF